MKRILIVEDDVALCLRLSDMLNEFGFETGVSDSLARTMSMLNVAEPLPDIILLDLHMPNLEGYKLSKALQNHSKYCKIPVIHMTATTATPANVEVDIGLSQFDVLKQIQDNMQ